MADKQITPFQLTDQFTMDNFNQRINETNIALQSKPNPNLLDNWYFGNPVNQRGQTSYTGAGYGIDRWKIAYNPDSLSLLVTDSGLKVGGSITTGLFLGQWFEDGFAKGLINRICTVSLLFSDGTFVTGSGVFPEKDGVDATLINTNDVIVYFQYNASSQNKPCVVMVLKNASKAVFAAKLELGSQQTLAHQENGVWVLNELPDYGEQLARCQRYAIDLNPNRQNIPIIGTVKTDGTTMWLSMPISTSLRTTPVITNSRGTVVVSNDSGSSGIAFGNDARVSSGMITIAMTGSTKRDGFAYMIDSGGVGIPTALLSADL